MSKFILVTGGAGFIGSFVVDELIKQGNKVLVIDNLSTGKLENINSNATFYCGSILDRSFLNKIFAQHDICNVIHLAAIINQGTHQEDCYSDIEVSLLGTINLLDLSVKYGITRFIFSSSVSVYGRALDLPVHENTNLIPINSYGWAKVAAENYVKYYSSQYGLVCQILRYGNIYGPRQPKNGEVGVVGVFTDQILNNRPLTLYGDGSQQRDFLYVEDCAKMTIETLNINGSHILNISSGVPISILEIIRAFSEIADRELIIHKKPFTSDEVGRFYASMDAYKSLTLISTNTSLKTGLENTLNYFTRKVS